MAKKDMVDALRNLINKIYNEVDLSDSVLKEIESDLKKIDKLVGGNKAYRELCVLVDAAKKQKNVIGRSKFKFAILSGLEREYKSIITQNAK